MTTSYATAQPQRTVFNAAQLYLLDIFAGIHSEQELEDIKQLVASYYAKKMEAHMAQLWDEGTLDQQRLDEINEMDLHRWLREQRQMEQERQEMAV